MRAERQQRPRFGEQPLGVAGISRHPAHLEGHVAPVSAINGPNDGALAAPPDDRDDLVSAMQESGCRLGHISSQVEGH